MSKNKSGNFVTSVGGQLRAISAKFLIAVTMFALCRDAKGQCEGQWAEGLSLLPGLGGTVNAMVVFNDGTGDALYVGGSFTIAGDTMVANIAKWDGSRWSPLGSGMSGSSQDDDEVYALTVFDDGGGPALYAGGEFNTAGGVSANRIAKWDGSSWSALGSGMGSPITPFVSALTVFDDGGGPALYAGGNFTTAGDVSASNIAKWDGSSWSALGSGTSGSSPYSDDVYALTVFDDGEGPALYAGGDFTTAGGVSANRIAKWNGSSWSALGSGISGTSEYPGDVYALTVFDDGGGPALYAGGWFTRAGGLNVHHIAKWNGSSWSAVGSGVYGSNLFPDEAAVYSLMVFDDGGGPALYVGGWFVSPGYCIAKWDGKRWSGLRSGVSYLVAALTVFNDGGGEALFAGGWFDSPGNNIAKWDGATWSTLGTGINKDVLALAVFDDGGGPTLYAVGSFIIAGSVGANRIAKWDPGVPGQWSALGSGMNDNVHALAVYDDGGGPALFAAGSFTTAGGTSANRIAKWDGSSWSALASGIGGSNPYAGALTVFDDGGGLALYVGGNFATVGGVNANRIAKWDGSSWSPLGSGMNGTVSAFAVFDDGGGPALYAGGSFTSAGGVSANRIAKWNGATWSALQTGMSGDGGVYALTVFDEGGGPALYAGGYFSTAGGVNASHIAKWDGVNWSPLGSGVSRSVYVLTVFDDGGGPALHAGGSFTTAGGVSANYIAKWDSSGWSSLGAGTNYDVSDLTVFDNGGGPALYAGGRFTTAGGKISPRFARWSSHPEADAAGFAAGMTGPLATPECKPYDYDCDGDVDLQDYTRLLFRVQQQ